MAPIILTVSNFRFLAVSQMAAGVPPGIITKLTIQNIAKYYPKFSGALIAVDNKGTYGELMYCIMSNYRYMSVNSMLMGNDPTTATLSAMTRITDYYLNFVGAIVAVTHQGQYGRSISLIHLLSAQMHK